MNSICIDFKYIESLIDVLKVLEEVFFTEGEFCIEINIPAAKMIYPEYLIVIVGAIRFLRYKGIKCSIKVNNPGNNTYVSRINFYKELGLDIPEYFKRHDSTGRFIEITPFNKDNSVQVTNDIMKIIKENFNIDKNLIGCLNYCLFEMIDNVQNHAESPIDGYTVAQYYPNLQELRIVILDTGIGIYRSLTKSEKYKDLSPEKALLYCTEKGVTRGYGCGNGLYDVRRIICDNDGELKIFSGDNYLDLSRHSLSVQKSPYWQGTIIYVRINTNKTVNIEKLFGNNIPVTISEYEECIYGLW